MAGTWGTWGVVGVMMVWIPKNSLVLLRADVYSLFPMGIAFSLLFPSFAQQIRDN